MQNAFNDNQSQALISFSHSLNLNQQLIFFQSWSLVLGINLLSSQSCTNNTSAMYSVTLSLSSTYATKVYINLDNQKDYIHWDSEEAIKNKRTIHEIIKFLEQSKSQLQERIFFSNNKVQTRITCQG
ncbi:hypothetical protein ACJW30_04G155700 [Castanea mollissima]